MNPGFLRTPLCLSALLLLLAAGGTAVLIHSGGPEHAPQRKLAAERSSARAARPEEPRDATSRLASILRETDPALRQSALCAWMDADPVAAGAALLKLASLDGMDATWPDLAGQLAARWIASDPDAAIVWITSMPDGPARVKAEVQGAYSWTEIDPAAAAAYSAQRDNPKLREVIAAKWSESDPAGALGWLAALPPEKAGTTAMARAAAVWAQVDPASAATFAGALEDPAAREAVSAAVVSGWAMTDTAAVGKWLATLPGTAGRDRAVDVYCQALDPVDPELSFDWAASISDEDARASAIRRAAGSLAQKDPPAARRRISASALPQPLKDELLAAIGD
jgi:hypothetical protein